MSNEYAALVEREPRVIDLARMLQYRRPAWSRAERKFIKRWIRPLDVQVDAFGNLIKRIGDSNVLWSCHTDTVHKTGGFQKVALASGAMRLARKEKESNCLGADDTAGIWLMRELILANKPGLYVFHRCEEKGGQGSDHIAKKTPELLKGIDIAIAFDRRAMHSVITHQYGRCCSREFGEALSDQLGGQYRCDDTGIFTDTANYTSLVSECTNISVGYDNEHTKAETLCVRFLVWLRDRLLDLDTSTLPVKRDPSVAEFDSYDWSRYYGHSYRDEYESRNGVLYYRGDNWRTNKALQASEPAYTETSDDDAPLDLIEMMHEYPHEVADYLEHCGIDANDVWEYLMQVLSLDKTFA